MAVDVTVYPGRVKFEEVSSHAHRDLLLVADPADRTGARLAEQVADLVNGADYVYLNRVGDSADLHRTIEARLQALDGTEIRTEGKAADHVVGDVPIRGGKVVRPADEGAVVTGEPPEGFRAAGEPPEAGRPLEPKPVPSLADSAGTTYAHHMGGKRLRTGDEDTLADGVGDEGADQAEQGDQYDAMNLDQLQDELRGRTLPVSGNKAELQARLREDDHRRAAE